MDSESIDFKTGIELLQKQIGQAEHLLKNRPVHSKDHANWNDTTRDCLTKIYNFVFKPGINYSDSAN